VICGMGGSAIGGDLVASYLRDVSPLPIEVVRSFSLPKHVSQKTLAIVSSYSGNTAESLSLFEQARESGAQIICMTTGGELEALAIKHQFPLIKLTGGMQPRAALAFSFVPLLVFVSAVLQLEDPREKIVGTAKALKQFAVDCASESKANPAKMLAEQLRNKIAVVYSSDRLSSVNLRWRGQLQENANHLAFGNLAPELTHNEINGWGFPERFGEQLYVILLRDTDDDPSPVSVKLNAIHALLTKKDVQVTEVSASGNNNLERIFSLISLADWTSYHLAILEGIDPTSIPAIDELKRS
jgi:glucose/mannose-6-phosphate isomerase